MIALFGINHMGTPWALLLLMTLPVVAAAALMRPRRALRFSSAALPLRLHATFRTRLRWLPSALRVLCLALLVFALARPQETSGQTKTSTEGVAMQLVIDRSYSMREPIPVGDEQVSKLELVKRVVHEFVAGNGHELKGRPSDMIGLICFARYADTLAPLALGHEALLEATDRISLTTGSAADPEAGTAIGEGLSLAAARLKRAEDELAARTKGGKADFAVKSKVIVLLTDGQNNQGQISPREAVEQAKNWGIRVYTIGVGAGARMVRMGDQRIRMGDDIDERMLTAIAELTGGKFWRAENGESLQKAYAEIDALEKSRIDSTEYTSYTERFLPFAAVGGALLALELLLAGTLLRRTP